VDAVALVDLQMDQNVFDWCDLNSYSPAGVKAILEAHHINQTMIDNGLHWVAINPAASYCDDFDYTDLALNYIMSYDSTLAPFNQRTGAIGVISSDEVPSVWQYTSMGGVNMRTGLVSQSLFTFRRDNFKDLESALVGTSVTIFGALVSYSNDGGDFNKLVEAVGTSRDNNVTFMVSHMEDDPDTINDGYVNPSSPFYYYHRIAVALACTLCAVAIIHNLQVFHILLLSQSAGLFYYTSLTFSLLGTVARFMVVLDPFSLLGYVTYEWYYIAVSLTFSLQVFSSAASLMVWFSVLNTVSHAAKSIARMTKVFHTNIVVKISFFALIVLLGVADMYSTYVTNVIVDPSGQSDWTYMLFESKNSEGVEDTNTGLYTEGFLKAVRLVFLAVVEIAVAVYVNKHLGTIRSKEAHKHTNQSGIIGTLTSSAGHGPASGTGVKGDTTVTKTLTAASPATAARILSYDGPTGVSKSNKVAPSSPVTLLSRDGGGDTRLVTRNNSLKTKHDVLMDMEKLHFYKKLENLSRSMIVSGVLMILTTVFILLQSLGSIWLLCKRNPYFLNFFFSMPFVLLQLSSMSDVKTIKVAISKMAKPPVLSGDNNATSRVVHASSRNPRAERQSFISTSWKIIRKSIMRAQPGNT
jgi:hypothetical protein